METENILMEDIKVKSKYKIPLVILGVLIVVLVGIGCYFYFKTEDSRSTYIKIIDTLAGDLIENLDGTEEQLNNPISSDYDLSFSLTSNSAEFKEIANILNNLKLNMNMEMDIDSKKAIMNVEAIYKNESMINADLVLNDKDVYGNLNELYDKKIKLEVEGIEQIWEVYDFKVYKTVVKEISNILKNNLKEEYFTTSKETIEVLGKNVKTTKNTMILTGQNIYDLENNILKDIESNKELMNALISISGLTEEEIKTSLESARDELVLDDANSLVIDLYVNKREIVKAVVKDNEEEKLKLTESKDNEYEISVNEAGTFVVIGSIISDNNKIKAEIDYEGFVMSLEVSEDLIYISTKAEEDIIELRANVNDTKSNGYVRVVSKEEDMDLKVNFTNEYKDINKVKDIDVSNYIQFEQMTDDDYNTIMQALYQNNALLTLIQDVMSLSSISSY